MLGKNISNAGDRTGLPSNCDPKYYCYNHKVSLYGLFVNYNSLTTKKTQLDELRPLPAVQVRNLEEWFRVELTYTSNAIEGNTLTRAETAMVVEKGLTVGGKTLIEHLEAANHADALSWVNEQIDRSPQSITQRDILAIHNIILKGIDDDNAGRFRNVAVRISGSMVVLPNPRKLPDLMDAFESWLSNEGADLHPVELATEAHYQLVSIHPFTDGNGRTARLLMNMILLMQGYPPAIIRTRDRLAYINALETAQLGGSKEPFLKLVAKAVERSLDLYLKAATNEVADPEPETPLLTIGKLAKATETVNSTLRHWVKEGLLGVAETTPAGYQLFDRSMILRVERIRNLQAKRLTLAEIKGKLLDS